MLRLLVIDDNARFRGALTRVLALQPGVEMVAQAGSLAKARRSLEDIDVALLDLNVPDGEVTELIGELREANPGVWVLILTASLEPDLRHKINGAGADGIIEKMATPDEMIGVIQRLAGAG